jgi:hypothetical protein
MRTRPPQVSFPDLGLLVQHGPKVTVAEVDACYSFANCYLGPEDVPFLK